MRSCWGIQQNVRKLLWLLAYFSLEFSLRGVGAVCPNNCSGHGECGAENTCSCNSGWDFAADCSLRTCPTAPAWADRAYATDTGHTEVECANGGLCNRESGTCECFAPYVGTACQRLRCPSDCQSRGICMTTREAALFYGPDYLQPNANGGDGLGPTYSLWDGDSTTMCVCDKGYFGSSCEKRMCPKGDDPLTIGQTERSIVVSMTSGGNLGGTARITFNGYTIAITPSDFSTYADADCEADFERLPNVEDVSCTVTTASAGTLAMTVTFDSWPMFPVDNNVHSHVGNPDITAFTCDVTDLTSSAGSLTCSITDSNASDTPEYEFCSRRGVCDFDTGLCSCYDGWTGANCGTESYAYSAANSDPGISLLASGSGYVGSILELKSEKSGASDFNFLECDAGGTVMFKIRGDGNIEIAELVVTERGQTIELGGLTIEAGGLDVQAGGAQVTSTQDSTDGLQVDSSTSSFTGNVLKLTTANFGNLVGTSDQNYLIRAGYLDDLDLDSVGETFTDSFSVRADGGTTIQAGGLTVVTDDITISDGGLSASGILTSGGLSTTAVITVGGMSSAATITTANLASSGAVTIDAGGLTIGAGGANIGGNVVITGTVAISGVTSITNAVNIEGVITQYGPTGTSATFSGDVYGAMFVTTSDRRLKDDISSLSTSLEELTRLRGVSFKWKPQLNEEGEEERVGENPRQIGFIAQEILEVFPELVFEGGAGRRELERGGNDEDGGDGDVLGDHAYLGVNYQGFSAVLLEGLKELNSANNELAQRVASMEKILEKFDERLSDLEADKRVK